MFPGSTVEFTPDPDTKEAVIVTAGAVEFSLGPVESGTVPVPSNAEELALVRAPGVTLGGKGTISIVPVPSKVDEFIVIDSP